MSTVVSLENGRSTKMRVDETDGDVGALEQEHALCFESLRADSNLDALCDHPEGLMTEVGSVVDVVGMKKQHSEKALAEGRCIGDGLVGRADSFHGILLRGTIIGKP